MAQHVEPSVDAAWPRKIAAYIRRGERGVEPVYVGREPLFEMVASNAVASLSQGGRGRVSVIFGAPGSGKSAFLDALARRANAGPLQDAWGEATHTAVIRLEAGQLDGAANIERGLAAAISKRDFAGFLSRMNISVDLFGFKVGMGAGAPASHEPAGAFMDSERLRQTLKPLLDRNVAVVLAVDEAQNLVPTTGNSRRQSTFLASLQGGMGTADGLLPVSLLCLGLSDTESRLAELGLSRLAGECVQPMSRLGNADVRKYALGILDHLEADAADQDKDRIAHWVARESLGWPVHMRGHMAAIARGMALSKSPRLADLDMHQVEQLRLDARNRYYASRLGDQLAPYRPVVMQALLAQQDDAGLPEHEWRQVLWQHADAAVDSGSMRPESKPSGDALFVAMLHQGILHPTDADPLRFACPISSMRQYLEHGRHITSARPPELGRI